MCYFNRLRILYIGFLQKDITIMEQVRTAMSQRSGYSIDEGHYVMPPTTPMGYRLFAEQGVRYEEGKFMRFMRAIGLNNWAAVDVEATNGETIANKKAKGFLKKVSKFFKNFYILFLIAIGVFCLFYFSFPMNSGCIAKGNNMCKIKDDGTNYKTVLLANNEHRYEYESSMNYKDYCDDVVDLSHSILSVWKNSNGIITYFMNTDVHEEHETVEEPKPDTNPLKKALSYFYDGNTPQEAAGSNMMDLVCTFDIDHDDYKGWLKDNKKKDNQFFDLTAYEIKGKILHANIFNLGGLWDMSKSTVVNMMMMTIDSGSSNCSCAHEHGFYKNIISYKTSDGVIKTMYNPKIVSREGSISYKKPFGGFIGSWMKHAIMIPSSVGVSFINEYGYTEKTTMNNEYAACALICTIDGDLYGRS
jgi:hypothetical protein